jgi:hypothetical protein
MDEKKLLELADEIAKQIYDGLTDDQIADALNATDKTANTKTLSGPDVGALVDVGEFKSLTPEQLTTLYEIWKMDAVPIESGFYREFLLDAFKDLPVTLAAFTEKLVVPTSFAELFGIRQMQMRKIGSHHIAQAREAKAKKDGVFVEPPVKDLEKGQATKDDLNVTLPNDLAQALVQDAVVETKDESDGVTLSLADVKQLMAGSDEATRQAVGDYLLNVIGLHAKDVADSQEAALG